jgi:myo-inositol-1(or 4)-monophosphatase
LAFALDRELQFAFLYNPPLNQLFTARKGQGAFLNGKRIYASKQETLKGSLVAHEISLGCVPALTEASIERTRQFLANTIGIRCIGSAALTMGYLAMGAIDGYNIEYLAPWDIAAGALILQESGGVVIDISGAEYNIMKPNIIAAGTMKFALEMKAIIDETDEKLKNEGKHPSQLLQKLKK